jgi:hypothetical protein
MPNHDYAAAVDYLVAHPEEIRSAWHDPYDHVAGCLFRFCGPYESRINMPDDCGCLTMIRSQPKRFRAYNASGEPADYLTKAIAGDDAIRKITHMIDLRGPELREALNRYAEWQTALETELLL